MLVTHNHIYVKTSTKKFMGTNLIFQEMAKKYAVEKRSYVFQIFKNSQEKGFSNTLIHVGYAVPK